MHDAIRNKSSMQEEATAVCLKATEVAGEMYCLRHTIPAAKVSAVTGTGEREMYA